MLRNKIISIVALATIGLALPTGAFARGGGGGHGGGGRRFSRRWQRLSRRRIWFSRRRISRTRVRLFRAMRLRWLSLLLWW
jgi:hypothetical protein